MTATPDSTAPQDSAPTPDDAAPVLGEQGRPEPPQAGDETATLRGFLDFQRATFAWRTDGLDAEGLRRRLDGHPSPMTLGGMLKHLAYVEAHWFVTVAHGQPWPHPWADVDWDADRDWDWNSAAEDSPERLAEVTPESGSYRLDAFGTTEGAGITDSAREVRSKMRRAELDASGLDDVTVVVDGSASMQVNVTPKIVEAAAKYIDALSDAFKRFRATDGQDSIQTHKVDELTRFISGVIENGAERVGQRPWHGPNIVSTSSLAIYVTDSPVASMVDTGVPTVVLITSAIGRQELELARINGTPRQVAYAVIDEDVVKQLDSGANTELSELTDRVTAMLKERNS